MEVYLASIINYHLKPNKRFWVPGQKEATVLITAPKTIEKPRARNINEEEAGRRLSFLADLVDTEGYSIRNGQSSLRDEYLAEANSVTDILDSSNTSQLDVAIAQEQSARHAEVVSQMRSAINRADTVLTDSTPTPTTTTQPQANMVNLANNPAFSVETIQKEANRLQNQGGIQ